MPLRKNYQTCTMRPILWTCELLYGAGFDVYNAHQKRLTRIVNADPRAKKQGPPFEDVEFWRFVKKRRLKCPGCHRQASPRKGDGYSARAVVTRLIRMKC